MPAAITQESIKQDKMLLVGIQVRTNNAQEYQKLDGKIFPLVKRYFHEALAELIPNRKKPGTTLCAYTEYASDYKGDYTYFIGEEVSALDLPEGFSSLTIPKQTYTKFTTGPAPMPEVLSDAWQTIWEMETKPEVLGGTRRYHTDFEIYDERAADHQNIVLDIYIGLND